VLAVPLALLLVMAAIPWFGDWYETGHWPKRARELATEVTVSGVTIVVGWWVLTLVRREQRSAAAHLAELERLTLTDPLTGLGNRRALERDLARTLCLSERVESPLALLYMDVDHFKQINDRFGHAMGDETLRTLGAVLRTCSRVGTDAAYRVGGDEFVMTLMTDRTGAELLAQRVAQDFYQRSPQRSQLSLGVVVWDGHASAAQLLDFADARMYQNKLAAPARRGLVG
jgi:diguanylate cyclase (GGDEF)-like protein